MENCPNLERNREDCPCSNEKCERRGLCCECIASHRKRGYAVACMRPEALELSKLPEEVKQ